MSKNKRFRGIDLSEVIIQFNFSSSQELFAYSTVFRR